MNQNEAPHDSETNTVEAADTTELWEPVATESEAGGASMEEYLSADSAASLCEEISDRVIVVATDSSFVQWGRRDRQWPVFDQK